MLENNLRLYRKKYYLTQKMFSELIEVNQSNVSSVELGKIKAWPKLRYYAAKLFKVPQKKIFPGYKQVQTKKIKDLIEIPEVPKIWPKL